MALFFLATDFDDNMRASAEHPNALRTEGGSDCGGGRVRLFGPSPRWRCGHCAEGARCRYGRLTPSVQRSAPPSHSAKSGLRSTSPSKSLSASAASPAATAPRSRAGTIPLSALRLAALGADTDILSAQRRRSCRRPVPANGSCFHQVSTRTLSAHATGPVPVAAYCGRGILRVRPSTKSVDGSVPRSRDRFTSRQAAA